MSETTPTLEEVISEAIADSLLNLYTSMPGQVVSYDPAKQTISVKPCIKSTDANGVVTERPQIDNVPVMFPRGKKSSFTFPIQAGDPVLLVFSMRSLDVWKQKGGIVDPLDFRKFNITDAFAIPGGSAKSKVLADAHASHARLVNDKAMIEMQEAGKFRITNGTEELLDLMDQLIACLQEAKTTTAIGPQPLWANTQTVLSTIKTKLGTLKG
jgi:hypothetical protein